jgi:hypothetical protein
MDWHDHITSDPMIMGKPCFRGTRISVYLILQRIALGSAWMTCWPVPGANGREHHGRAAFRR